MVLWVHLRRDQSGSNPLSCSHLRSDCGQVCGQHPTIHLDRTTGAGPRIFQQRPQPEPLHDRGDAPRLPRVGTQIYIEPDGPRFVADTTTGIEGAISALFAITARAMIDGTWRRLKACPGRHCGWAFYDHSRNQSGRWCSMKVCGDRDKARAYYERKTGGDP